MIEAVLAQVTAAAPLPPGASGYGVALARSLLTLVAVCVLAWWVLRWAARRGLGGQTPGGVMRVRERLPLDAQHAVYLVEVGRRKLLLGASERGLSTLAELDDDDLRPAATEETAPPVPTTRTRFADVVARWRGEPAEIVKPAKRAEPHGHDD